ncbi:MAG: electron transfer flavoprotein subunit beta/FixA family protein [Acidimicrobiia bacterium]|nr:electron transfer flavoprotein subunit beta/FixA family protein [Acidimicrobiia bacterium]
MKRVPAPGARINITDDGQNVDTTHLAFTTSPHEECAVEAAAQLVEEHGGEAIVLTLGPAEAEEQLRYAVSVGAQRGVLVLQDDESDPQRTSRALTTAIGELEADGPFDLVLFGNESADSGGFQVGIRVAHALGRPVVNGAKALAIDDGSVNLERETEAGRERYVLPLPAVVGVKEGINLPRYPTMRGRLASKKADIASEAAAIDVIDGALTMELLERPPETESSTIFLGEGPDAAAAVVDVLGELGVLS